MVFIGNWFLGRITSKNKKEFIKGKWTVRTISYVSEIARYGIKHNLRLNYHAALLYKLSTLDCESAFNAKPISNLLSAFGVYLNKKAS